MTTPRRVDGIDISHHQAGTLDLAGAKKRGLKWVYHKATEGASYTDPNYTKRRAEAKRAGLPFGAYHFARPDKTSGDAAKEARRFLSVAKPVPGDLRPALDLETHDLGSLAAVRVWAAAFIAEVVKATGVKPIVYTPYDLGDAAKGCLIWRPRYNNQNTPPVLAWDIWQFSNGVFGVPNSLAGIGHCDLNTMRTGLTVAQMQIPQPKPPAPKQTTTLRVATANIKNFPDMSPEQVLADMKEVKSTNPNLVLWQEIGEQEDFDAIIAAFGNKAFGSTDSYSSKEKGYRGGNVTTWQRDRLMLLESDLVKIGETMGAGTAHPSQWMVASQFKPSLAWLPQIDVFCIHLIVGAYNAQDKPYSIKHKAELRQRWDGSWKKMQAAVLASQKAGHIAIFGGDWNRKQEDIPLFAKDQKWVVGGGIDSVGILLPKGFTATASGSKSIDLNSDHNLRLADVKIAKA